MTPGYLESRDTPTMAVAEYPLQELVNLEDMLLLSRYDEAAEASGAIVQRFSKRGRTADALLQRVLVTAFQAHFFIGRPMDVEAMVDKLGVARLTVPTFMTWALLLLESGQALEARRRVERYMAAVITLVRERQLADAEPAATALEIESHHKRQQQQQQQRSDADLLFAPPTTDLQQQGVPEERHDPDSDDDVGAAAASLQDRAALARLYTQDVLCLGLDSPLEALRWLQPAAALPHQQPPFGGNAGGSDRPGCTAAAAAACEGVVDALELLGGCEETLQRLRTELMQLTAISGLTPLPGMGDEAAAAVTDGGRGGGGVVDGVRPKVPATAGQSAVAGAKAASSQALHGGINSGVSAFASAAVGSGGSSGVPGGPAGREQGVRGGAAVGGRASPADRFLSGGLAGPTMFSFLRAVLATVHAVVRQLVLGASLQLSRTQTWLVCKGAAIAARLRELSVIGHGGAVGTPLGRVAVAAVIAAVVLVAAQAEAPYLRTKVEQQWGLLAGLVREAVRMGLALHPSPVATAASTAVR